VTDRRVRKKGVPKRPPATKVRAGDWQRRVSSPAFARELTALIARDLRALADQRFKDVVDMRLVRDLIERTDELLVVDAVAALGVSLRDASHQRMRKAKRPLRDILGSQLIDDIEAMLDDATNLSHHAETFIEGMMQRELVQSLMTDLVYTAIVSFNRRFNPLFGNLALMAIDTQIKSFIRMFMPMLQRQATAFLVDRKNHALFADFARAALRQILNEPVVRLVEIIDRGSQREAEALIAKTARNPQVRRLARETVLMWSEAAFRQIGNLRVGDVLRLDANAAWLAKRLTAPVQAALKRPHLLAFLSQEIDRASRARP
jgi:hypothetical protein